MYRETYLISRPQSGLNEREVLTQWLSKDIGDIRSIEAIDVTRSFVENIHRRVAAGETTPPDWLGQLDRALRSVEGLPDDTSRLALLNQELRALFIKYSLTENSYNAHCESLRSGEELALRRRARSPLPTMDALIYLAGDPRDLTVVQRAALLTSAALQYHSDARIDPEDVRIFGTTLVPGEEGDEMATAREDLRILVLACGVPYVVFLGDAASEVPAGTLQQLFEAICNDAALFAYHPESWTSAVPMLVTAVSRPLCGRLRRALEADLDNACALRKIDRCLFAVCLDTSPKQELPGSRNEFEDSCSRLFGNYKNRWYGMTALVVDSAAEAGIIASYTRGIEAVPVLSFAQDLLERSLKLPIPDYREVAAISVPYTRIQFVRTDLGDLETEAYSQVAKIFHDERSFFDLGAGTAFFQSIGVSAHAALQYLLILASHEVSPQSTFPALSHAVSTREGAGLKGGLDWALVSTSILYEILGAIGSAEMLRHFKHAANEHSFKVNAARRGYSPSSFLEKPDNLHQTLLYEFFLKLGLRYETAYRGHLFRVTRWPGAMDILTSTLNLPDGVLFCGRPGSTNEVAAMFGLHIVMKPDRTHLFFIPNPRTKNLLCEFHRALERWIVRLKEAAAELQTERSAQCA